MVRTQHAKVWLMALTFPLRSRVENADTGAQVKIVKRKMIRMLMVMYQKTIQPMILKPRVGNTSK